MTIAISFGKYGGFYIYRGYMPRICLGWMAITIMKFDFDVFLEKMLVEKKVLV